MKAAVIGFPIQHSLSPKIYSYLAKKFNVKLNYSKQKISASDLAKFIQKVKKENYIGFNITIPHKTNVIEYIDIIDSDAKPIGAINVVQKKNQKLIGYNTDVMGILFTLKDYKITLKNKDAFIYGAGGAARAVAVVCAKQNAKTVFVLNRTHKTSQKLCKDLARYYKKTKFIPVHRIQQNCFIYFNATSMGMASSSATFSKELFPNKVTKQKALAFDCVYNPVNTDFLKEMKRKGFQTITGVNMFVWQALFTWKIWYQTPLRKLKKFKKPLVKIVSSGNK